MNIILVFLCIITFIVLYFCVGIVLSFLMGWWPILIYVLTFFVILIVEDLSTALYTIPIGLILLFVTDSWQGTTVYLNMIEKLDKKFYFKD